MFVSATAFRCRVLYNKKMGNHEYYQRYYQDNKEQFRKRTYKYYQENRKEILERGKKWRIKNREWFREYARRNKKYSKATEAIRQAINRGDLIRKPCIICGDNKSEAHHPDYSKLLDVRWLCKKHHAFVHSSRICLLH
jgi:hypothetical protein